MLISCRVYPIVVCALSIAVAPLLVAQGAQTSAPPAPQAAPTHTARPPAPTRDPHEPGYVAAKELPDGAVPDPNQDGNFILGATHTPAPELKDDARPLDGTVVEFTMNSADSKYFPGIQRSGDFKTASPDPHDPATLLGIETHPPLPTCAR